MPGGKIFWWIVIVNKRRERKTNQVCENVGIGRSRCCTGHSREEYDNLEMLVIMSISIGNKWVIRLKYKDLKKIWCEQKNKNRKGAGAVGSVNVQIVVQLSKDLSGGLEFGTIRIITWWGLYLRTMDAWMKTWLCGDDQHHRVQEGKGQGGHWDQGVDGHHRTLQTILTHQLLHEPEEGQWQRG